MAKKDTYKYELHNGHKTVYVGTTKDPERREAELISPICLRQHPFLFFQDSSRHVNDALAYRTAIVYSRSLTRTNTDNA